MIHCSDPSFYFLNKDDLLDNDAGMEENTSPPCPKQKKTKTNSSSFIRPAFYDGQVFVLFIQPV